MERKLASLQKVSSVQTHPNADVLDIATILGWQVVVKRNEFKAGDLCVYCEIDSIMPDKPEFEFLRSKDFRIRTVRLRNVISQGIAFPLSILSNDINEDIFSLSELKEGFDVTDIIGVTKYEPPIKFTAGEAKGNFPGFLTKTDETRVQSVPTIIDRYRGMKFDVNEKIDGSSITMYLRDDEFGVCSRSLNLKPTDNSRFWIGARKYDFEKILRTIHEETGDYYAFQGELVGPSICENKLQLPDTDVYIFNIFNMSKGRYMNVNKSELPSRFGFKTVPYLGTFELNHTVEDLVKFATRNSEITPSVLAEGTVWRPNSDDEYNTIDWELGRLSFKVINPEWNLKFKE